MSYLFTTIAIVAIAVSTLLHLHLAIRHIRHVKASRHSVPDTFSTHISLADHQRAADYTIAKTTLSIASTMVGCGLTLAFTLGGGLAWIATSFASIIHSPLLQGTMLIACVVVLSSIVTLPLSLIATFGIEAHFGFNTMTLKLFIIDYVKQALLAALIGLPLAALALWLLGTMGKLWWLYVWLVWVGFSLVMLFLYPTVIAPLFNRFRPLDDPELTLRIETLLNRTGFNCNGIVVMDGSTRSRHGNAYFTGFGKAKRIVFYDTLLKQLTPAEIEAVLAHELGHFKYKHIRYRLVLMFALAFAFFFLLGQLINADWFYHGWGIPSPNDAAGLSLFFMLMPAFTFPLTPLFSLWSRHHEYQADSFAARETHADHLIQALVKLYRDNATTLTPDPLYSAFYDSHPPASLRVAYLKSHYHES